MVHPTSACTADAGGRNMEGKKPSGFFSPTSLLKKGWNGVTSPLSAMKESMTTPRGTNSAHRTTAPPAMPSPAEYPSLFDVRTPSSTRSTASSMDGVHGHGMFSEAGTPPVHGRPATHSATTASSSRTNSRTGSRAGSRTASRTNSRTGSRTDSREHTMSALSASARNLENDVANMDEEERAYLEVCHHNLHSVLTVPKATTYWGGAGAILEALYPLDAEIPIPMIPFPGLDMVSKHDFEPYIRKYGKNAKMFEDNHMKPVSEQLSSSRVPSVSVANEDVAKCLSVVPSMFFRPTFDLTDPAMFEEVMAMTTTAPLQEELTGYLDRVEFTLLRQVSSRSDRFFEASADQEIMKKSIKVATDQVATLRKTMDRLRNGLADKSLDIVSLHRRQKRIAELHEVITMIETVKNAESAVEALVHGQDYTSALDLIENSQTILREHLKGIHALRSLGDKFNSYRGFIVSQISERFISIVTSPEWMFNEDGGSTQVAGSENRRGSGRAQKEKDPLTAEMKRLVEVLFRLDALNDVVVKYRDQMNEEIKVVVKTVVTQTIAVSASATKAEGGVSSTESKVSVQLRALNSDEFLKCAQMIFEHLLMLLQRAVVVHDLLVKTMKKKIDEAGKDEAAPGITAETKAAESSETKSNEAWSPSQSTSDGKEVLSDWKKKSQCTKVIKEMEEVIRKTCEFSQRSVSNLFAVRKEVQAVYTMPQLRLLYDTTMEFVISIEKMTGKTDYTLRGALFSQLKLFLEKYHHAQMTKLVSTLDHELWKNTEISTTRHKALEDLSSGRGVSLTLSDDREVTNDTAAPLKMVSICGKTFKVVWSVLLMLEIVMNYMSCAANFPVLATDVLQRSIEIFRLFNSRTTQLVLGAGAMQIARLKSISARHLAVASQSLELSMTLIPHIKAALAAHFTDRQKLLLEEFDRVLRDYAEHNDKIFSKFTSIVEDQMKRCLENVSNEIDYDSSSTAVPSKPMNVIAQSTLKLYSVLAPVLPSPQMKDIMTRVFDMFTQKLPELYKRVQPKTAAGKKRVIDDVSMFVQNFAEVQVVEFQSEGLMRHFSQTYRS
ncbi:TPA: LOW QUALITY PROTEIN: hypothetical protein N0F65_007171 [Lagenidium giganteum]|uniref:Vacuolar protein sorting-associated protein 54 n=1 Tax=Lagenidium giganteum TaxID=4803 RepID=A0AAV2ZAB3_9STRA|nr:TPA: LOW QUALITY PROTEIN: hypothetical protein N0F65_007171 [Lagenidium giganteum]